MKKRNYLGTINFDQKGGSPLRFLPDWNRIRALKQVTFQLELASRLHWQVFLEFEYPVPIQQIVRDLKEQGKQMHISNENTNKHPKAGRAYVTKGTAVDGHRYFWSKAKGYIGLKPVVPSSGSNRDSDDGDDYSREQGASCLRRNITFDGTNRDEVRERLKEMSALCRNYVYESVDSIKI